MPGRGGVEVKENTTVRKKAARCRAQWSTTDGEGSTYGSAYGYAYLPAVLFGPAPPRARVRVMSDSDCGAWSSVTPPLG